MVKCLCTMGVVSVIVILSPGLLAVAQEGESSPQDSTELQRQFEGAGIGFGATMPDEAKTWLKFLAGDWTREEQWWTEKDGWKTRMGKDVAELLAHGRAVVCNYKGEDGSSSVCMLGWDSIKKAIVETGFDSFGFSWTITYSSMDGDHISGSNVLNSPDGCQMIGTCALRRKGNAQYDVEIEVKTQKDKVLKSKHKVTRS